MALLWVQSSKTPTVPQINYETAIHGFILYSPISCMKTKVSCPMWLVTLRNKRYFFVCCLSLPSFLSLFFLFLHKNKQTQRSWGFSVPNLSLWVCHSTREWIRMSLDTVWLGTDIAQTLKNTVQVGWNLHVWLNMKISPEVVIFCQLVHWNNQWVNQYKFFAKSLYFAKCFNSRCLIVSKKIKIWTNEQTWVKHTALYYTASFNEAFDWLLFKIMLYLNHELN